MKKRPIKNKSRPSLRVGRLLSLMMVSFGKKCSPRPRTLYAPMHGAYSIEPGLKGQGVKHELETNDSPGRVDCKKGRSMASVDDVNIEDVLASSTEHNCRIQRISFVAKYKAWETLIC